MDHQLHYRILATGSASVKHRERLAENGVGRWITIPVPTCRVFIQRMQECIDKGDSMVVESTLSGRSIRRLIQTAKETGYQVTVVYVFLETARISKSSIGINSSSRNVNEVRSMSK